MTSRNSLVLTAESEKEFKKTKKVGNKRAVTGLCNEIREK
jgi:hypothetical protein